MVSVAVSLQQRLPGIVVTSGSSPAGAGTLRGFSGAGRSLQTEEVLALLRQQSMKMAASQQSKAVSANTQFQPRDLAAGATGVSHLQLQQEGGTKATVKQQVPTTVAQAEATKLMPSSSLGVVTGDPAQVKVEMVDQVRPSLPSSQTVKIVPTVMSQLKPSTSAPVASMQMSGSQLQQVLALQQQQVQAAAKVSKLPAPASTQSTPPGNY